VSGRYITYTLGWSNKGGAWHELIRNLDMDLMAGVGVHVDYVMGLLLRGTLDIDDMEVFENIDADGDGLGDACDACPNDSDNDADGDGICGDVDNCPEVSNPNDADTDEDGIPDGVEDTNHNGVWDAGETSPCEADSDGDGIQDGTELGYTLDDIGPDTDTGVFVPDLDPETTTDALDDDTDDDGRKDGEEDLNHNGRVDPGERDPNKFNIRFFPWMLLLLDE
jgi:hypothetical protein